MAKVKTRIRRNDTVQVITGTGSGKVRGEGSDRGERGKVLEVDRERGRALVQGIKMVYRHQRVNKNDPSAPKVGRVEKEAPIDVSNLMVVCPACDEPTRIGIREESAPREGGKPKAKRVRVCKRCGADIPERS